MSYSPLTTYVKLSPNCNKPRNKKVKKITIHHMAGNLTVEECGEVFASPAREASSNYAIDNSCEVGCYVEEENRAWTSSSPANDNQAITIELANDGGENTDWHVADKVIEKCIELCVDICYRNGIDALVYTGDSSGNLTRHNMFTSTTCPGPYLQSKFPYIAQQVNIKLEEKKGELNMTQYEELNNKIKALSNQIGTLQADLKKAVEYAGIKYAYNDKNIPENAKQLITKLQAAGALTEPFSLSESDINMLSLLDALNVFDNAIEYASVEEVPEWGRDVVSRMVSAKVILGDGAKLGLTEQTVKILVYLDRMDLIKV